MSSLYVVTLDSENRVRWNYIWVDKDDEDDNDYLAGRYIIDVLDELDNAARKLGLLPLTTFVHNDTNNLDEGSVVSASESWFDAEEGLQTVRGLLANLGTPYKPELKKVIGHKMYRIKGGWLEALREEMQALQHELENAAACQKKFRLAF